MHVTPLLCPLQLGLGVVVLGRFSLLQLTSSVPWKVTSQLLQCGMLLGLCSCVCVIGLLHWSLCYYRGADFPRHKYAGALLKVEPSAIKLTLAATWHMMPVLSLILLLLLVIYMDARYHRYQRYHMMPVLALILLILLVLYMAARYHRYHVMPVLALILTTPTHRPES